MIIPRKDNDFDLEQDINHFEDSKHELSLYNQE